MSVKRHLITVPPRGTVSRVPFLFLALLALAPLGPAFASGRAEEERPPADSPLPLGAILTKDAYLPGEIVPVALTGLSVTEGCPRAVLCSAEGAPLAAASFFDARFSYRGKAVYVALLAVPPEAPPENATVRLEGGALSAPENTELSIPLTILRRAFREDVIALDAQGTELITVGSPEKTAQAEQLWRVLGSFSPQALYDTGPWILPVTSKRRTSEYASSRVYAFPSGKKSTATRHWGVDFGVPQGTPVQSVGTGCVVLSRFRIVTGETVIVEQLPGVYVLYYHLSERHVQEGDYVERGEVLASSGNTGLSTGAHLHWELRVVGVAADPDLTTGGPLLDKDLILTRIALKYGR